MLILSGIRDEKFIVEIPPSAVPTHVEVMIVDVRGERVRVGFKAPRIVDINREKVHESKHAAYVPRRGYRESGIGHRLRRL